MNFCADIKVPKETGNVCVMTGCAGATEAESLAIACLSAHSYYVADPDGPRYPFALIQVIELCSECGGSGKRPKKRGGKIVAFGWLECKKCKGIGQWPSGEPVRVPCQ